jgi:hypothetical protein
MNYDMYVATTVNNYRNYVALVDVVTFTQTFPSTTEFILKELLLLYVNCIISSSITDISPSILLIMLVEAI